MVGLRFCPEVSAADWLVRSSAPGAPSASGATGAPGAAGPPPLPLAPVGPGSEGVVAVEVEGVTRAEEALGEDMAVLGGHPEPRLGGPQAVPVLDQPPHLPHRFDVALVDRGA